MRLRTLLLFAGLMVASAVPALAQVDISGEWARDNHEDQPHRAPGADLGDYTGMPINAAARRKAESWDASILSQPEQQAKPHPVQYSMRGPQPNFVIRKIIDQVNGQLIAYTLAGTFGRSDRTIWMDGRPHPSEKAEHTYGGFSTGEWIGRTLKVTTTHMKTTFINRNGVPSSYRGTMIEYFTRYGNRLKQFTWIDDPVYLEEPFTRTNDYVVREDQHTGPAIPFETVDELGDKPRGWVPHWPIGTTHTDIADRFGIPFEATRGGKESTYPEYMKKIEQMKAAEAAAKKGVEVRHVIAGTLALLTATVVIQAQQPKLTREEQMIVARSMEQPQPSAYPVPMPPGVNVEVLPVLGDVFMIAGAGQKSNIAVHVGTEGALIVDSGLAADSEQMIKAIGVLTHGPISYIVNTTFDPEHYGGNDRLSKAGKNPTLNMPNLTGPGTPAPAGGGGGGGGNAPARQEGAIIFAHENMLNRMSVPTGETPALPFALWPSNTFFTAKKTITFNDEPIELIHVPAAHTDGDVIVFFRRSDVIAAGDVINTYAYPAFDPKRGGSISGVLSALNDIVDIAVPRFNQMGGTRIVPGHGRILNEADVVEYRDMITIIHDRVKLGIEKNMTLAQIKAQQPTLDYDGLYSSPALTGEMYVEAIFNDLKSGRSK